MFSIGLVLLVGGSLAQVVIEEQYVVSWRDRYIWTPMQLVGTLLLFVSIVLWCWRVFP